jgi:hypothetical protein
VLSSAFQEEEKKVEAVAIAEESKAEEGKTNNMAFVDFAPCLLIQNQEKKVKIFETFVEALDVYFSSMETKSERAEYEQKAWKKYENIKVIYCHFLIKNLELSL